MKKLILILIALIPLFSHSQNWQWVKQVGGNAAQSFESGHVITDGTNFYLYGTFNGVMKLKTDTFYSNGNSNFYFIKFDNTGNEMWAKTFGGYNGTNQYESMGCIYDSTSNSIYLSGIFWGTMRLGSDTVYGNAYYNNFIARMDMSGNFLWAKTAWTKNTFNLLSEDDIASLFIQPGGGIYLTTSVLDSANFNGFQVVSGGCLAKFDTNGNFIFAKHLFSNATKTNYAAIKFINDDLIIYGGFKQTFKIDTATLVSQGDYDMYLSRTDSIGRIIWIKQFGYGGPEAITSIATDNFNNLYCAAGFKDSISIDGHKYYNPDSDILLLKFDENGILAWGRQSHAIGSFSSANSIVIDNNGKFYVSGVFSSGSATFGTFPVSTTNLYDMFLAGYTINGDCLGVEHFGKADGTNVVVDNSGNPVIAGTFANTVSISNTNLTSSGPFDIYLAKHDAITGIKHEGKTSNTQLYIHANPNEGKCNITVPDDFLHEKNLVLSIYSSSGKLIQQKNLEMNEGKIKLNLEAEAKGLYNAVLSNGSKSYSGKIVFE